MIWLSVLLICSDTGKDKTQQFSEERYDNMNMTNGFIIKSISSLQLIINR